jgi:hypothetical protein
MSIWDWDILDLMEPIMIASLWHWLAWLAQLLSHLIIRQIRGEPILPINQSKEKR